MPRSANVRMQMIRQRTRQLRRKRAYRSCCFFSAVCLLSAGGIASLLCRHHSPAISIVSAGYSAVLLHSGTDAYIVVGVVSFVIGVLFTLCCLRYQRRAPRLHRSTSPGPSEASSPKRDSGP